MWLIFLELGVALFLLLVVWLALRRPHETTRGRDECGNRDDDGTR